MPGIGIPLLSFFFKFKLIFDMRGFWADEKHDRLGWAKKSFKYRFFKKLESYLIKRSDSIITLTNIAKKIICDNFKKNESAVEVISTCVDSHAFKRINHTTNINKIIIGYLGSIDTAYDFKKFLLLVKGLQAGLSEALELRILTNKKREFLEQILMQSGIKKIDLVVKFVHREELPGEISQFDFLGFCLKENFSVNASMPTKIAEALACGIPIVCNAFNEDIKKLIEVENIGLIYDFNNKFTNRDCLMLLKLIQDTKVQERCSDIAKNKFSLEGGVLQYRSIYSQLTT